MCICMYICLCVYDIYIYKHCICMHECMYVSPAWIVLNMSPTFLHHPNRLTQYYFHITGTQGLSHEVCPACPVFLVWCRQSVLQQVFLSQSTVRILTNTGHGETRAPLFCSLELVPMAPDSNFRVHKSIQFPRVTACFEFAKQNNNSNLATGKHLSLTGQNNK